MTLTETLWRTASRDRHFILTDAAPRPAGPLALVSLSGEHAQVDAAWAARFEVTEAEARRWAKEEAGLALGGLRRAANAKLAEMRGALGEARHAPVAPGSPVTPDAVPAVVALARALPRAVLGALSGEPARVVEASGALAAVEARLGAAGIDTHGKLGQFAFRLATLRREFEHARKG